MIETMAINGNKRWFLVESRKPLKYIEYETVYTMQGSEST